MQSTTKPSSTKKSTTKNSINELVINFHMTESCNYRCSYCYATWQDMPAATELHRQEGAVKALLDALAAYFFSDCPLKQTLNYQNVRLNFAGGEPMLLGERFHEAVKYANKLGFTTSLITNGHFLESTLLEELAPNLSMLGISYDTADPVLASDIGRIDRKKRWISPEQLISVCDQYRTLNPSGVLKLNTVVNSLNYQDDLSKLMGVIQPDKWKLLRVLPVYDKRSAITIEQFEGYVERHSALASMISVEDNSSMQHSYLMVNPAGCFYQNGDVGQGYSISDSILDVGVEAAFNQVPFDTVSFLQRYQSIPLLNIHAE
jgi:radical S-adenosyl methionine domain-containing protein 2